MLGNVEPEGLALIAKALFQIAKAISEGLAEIAKAMRDKKLG
jgi:hypothetical protein